MSNKKNFLKEHTYLLEYYIIIVLAIYFIGYLYVVGTTLGFTKENIFDVYNFNTINIINRTYIITGIKYLFDRFIIIIIAIIIYATITYIIYKKIKNILYYSIKRSNCKLLNSMIEKNNYKLIKDEIISSIKLCICYWYYYEFVKNYVSFGESYERVSYILLVIYLCSIFMIICDIKKNGNELLKVRNDKQIYSFKNYKIMHSKSKENRFFYSFLLIMNLIVLVISVILLIIMDGASFTVNKINKYNMGKEPLEIAVVKYNDDEEEDYINIQELDDIFIGYDINENKIRLIYIGNIKSIEHKKISKPKGEIKYTKGISKQYDDIDNLIRNFYDKSKNSTIYYTWLKENSTNNYFIKNNKDIDSAILDQQYNNSKEKKEMQKVIAEYMAVPEENDNEFFVKVMEIGESKNKYKIFKIVNEIGRYKIDDISETEIFDFDKIKSNYFYFRFIGFNY